MKNKNKKHQNENKNEVVLNEIPSKMELQGKVDEALPGTFFNVITKEGALILATLSGRLRLNKIRILPGDEVIVEVSPYDMSRGRISTRL
jgi:translation initiation factor IF-1